MINGTRMLKTQKRHEEIKKVKESESFNRERISRNVSWAMNKLLV